MRGIVRGLLLIVSGLAMGLGGLGLAVHFAGESEAVEKAREQAEPLLGKALAFVPGAEEDAAERLIDALAAVPLCFVVAPLGLIVAIATLLPGRSSSGAAEPAAGKGAKEGAPGIGAGTSPTCRAPRRS